MCSVWIVGVQVCSVRIVGDQVCSVWIVGVQVCSVWIVGVQVCSVWIVGVQVCSVWIVQTLGAGGLIKLCIILLNSPNELTLIVRSHSWFRGVVLALVCCSVRITLQYSIAQHRIDAEPHLLFNQS